MELERQVVFRLFGLPVTTTVVATWGMIVVLCLLGILAGRHLQFRPARWQAALEWGVSAIQRMIDEVVGQPGYRYLPMVATIGMFVLVANTMAILPFVDAPTADLNTPLALALVVFFSIHYFGIRERGLRGYLKHYFEPIPLLFPINILHYLSQTFSLTVRLFGNMLTHQLIVAILLLILPLVVPALLEILGLFVGILQAYIFTVLTIVYIGAAVQAEKGMD